MKVGTKRPWARSYLLTACRKSPRYLTLRTRLPPSALHTVETASPNSPFRLAASSPSTNETYSQLHTKMSSEPDVPLGASFRPLSRKRSRRVRISMSVPSATTVRKSRPSSRKSAKTCSMCWMIPSFPRPSQGNPRFSTTKCVSSASRCLSIKPSFD